MDSFAIELGKALGLPGFGPGALKANDGSTYALNRPEDFYLRVFENIALDGKPVPEAADEEIELAGLAPWSARLQRISPENWRRIAFVMARGGRYEGKEAAYKGEHMNRPFKGMISLYN
ncbi:MAG: tetrathionate reductase subunit A, partial [Desulfuromonadales bacterium]